MRNIFIRETENFIYNIIWLRKKHNLSKSKMAKLLGISVSSLNKLENGILPPRLGTEVIFLIQEQFHIHPKDLKMLPV